MTLLEYLFSNNGNHYSIKLLAPLPEGRGLDLLLSDQHYYLLILYLLFQ